MGKIVYLSEMFLFTFLKEVPCILLAILFIRVKEKKQWIKLSGLILSYVFIISITINNLRGSILVGHMNLIPFVSLYEELQMLLYGDLNYAIMFLGNLALFLPLGFFSCACFKEKGRYIKVGITGFLLSFLIELLQTYSGRCGDINDVILNTFGCLIGGMLYNCLVQLYPKGINKVLPTSKEEWTFKDKTVAVFFVILFTWVAL